ncbi:hypothetical protein [Planococcus salinus]|uniref:PH domain-containing protein n=1 Tax=Planococcus salinus TaxID=1848460 RepID=A0A3M8P6J0_9BACL|nr:hypothetical protein [Planococcus salinus]RNF38890.1 hypothetical protein EEX84_12280 [Planococcus salinus]
MEEEFHTQPLKLPNISMLISFSIVLLISLSMSGALYTWLAVVSAALVIYCIIQLNTKYKLMVGNERLVWTTSRFGKNLSTRKAAAPDIKAVTFKRFSFYRIVRIHLKQGFRWKLVKSKPDKLDESLQRFAEKHSIEVLDENQ